MNGNYTIDSNGCWLWNGCVAASGYSRMWDKRTKKADWGHRVAYREYKGEIPVGLTIDHLCRVRACVNPEHLEAVTQAENTARTPEFNGAKTHCPRGHEYNENNSYIYDKHSRRYCKVCQIEWNNNHKEQRRQYYWNNRDAILKRRKEAQSRKTDGKPCNHEL